MVVSPERFLEFWFLVIKYGWNYLPVVLSILSIFLTFIKFISYLRQVYAVYLFGSIVQPSIELKKEHVVMLCGLSFLQMLLVLLFIIALSYSMAPLEFGTIEGTIKLIISLIFASLPLNFTILVLPIFFEWIAERMLGVKRIYAIKGGLWGRIRREFTTSRRYEKYCPRCRKRFEITSKCIISNLTRDLILGFRCPHCNYIIKL